MDPLLPFIIPVRGLRNGVHEYHFDIDGEFFRAFESSPVQEGHIALTLTLDKRPDLYVLNFSFSGTLRTECDRCLAEIDLPVADEQQLLVKYSLDGESEEADVIFISPETQQLNVARFAYEYILLAMPMIRTYDCRSEAMPPCNEEMLRYLEQQEAAPPAEEGEQPNSVWDELKKWSKNKN